MSGAWRENRASREAILGRLEAAPKGGADWADWGTEEEPAVEGGGAGNEASHGVTSRYRDLPRSGEWQDLHAFAIERLAEAGVPSRMVATRWELVSTLTSQLYSRRDSAVVGDFSALFTEEPLFAGLRRQLPPVMTLMEASNVGPHDVVDCEVGITLASALLAQTGTLVLEADSASELACSLVPRTHWIVVPIDRIYADVHAWYQATSPSSQKYRVFVGGPSRTADIEKTLVWGVHGPWNLSVLFFRTDVPGRE